MGITIIIQMIPNPTCTRLQRTDGILRTRDFISRVAPVQVDGLIQDRESRTKLPKIMSELGVYCALLARPKGDVGSEHDRPAKEGLLLLSSLLVIHRVEDGKGHPTVFVAHVFIWCGEVSLGILVQPVPPEVAARTETMAFTPRGRITILCHKLFCASLTVVRAHEMVYVS